VLDERRDDIYRIAAEHGVTRLRVFGSVARGGERPDSDIDFLIETGPATSSWFPAGLIIDLEELLGRKVDVVTEASISPYIRGQVPREAKDL
jgi:predicted nucleotidyltransferase